MEICTTVWIIIMVLLYIIGIFVKLILKVSNDKLEKKNRYGKYY